MNIEQQDFYTQAILSMRIGRTHLFSYVGTMDAVRLIFIFAVQGFLFKP